MGILIITAGAFLACMVASGPFYKWLYAPEPAMYLVVTTANDGYSVSTTLRATKSGAEKYIADTLQYTWVEGIKLYTVTNLKTIKKR